MLSTVSPTIQAFAIDSIKGIETKVDRTDLDNAVKSANDAGVLVEKDSDLDKGVAKSKSELDAKIAEIKAAYNQQIQDLNNAKQEWEQYNADKEAYKKAKKKYDQDLAKYNIAKTKYEEDLEELKNHLTEDGYLKVPIGQIFTFDSEPRAVLEIKSGGTEYDKGDFYNHALSLNYLNDDAAKKRLLMIISEIRIIIRKIM